MTEPYRSPQATITPTILLGLGGTGSRIVDRIAARAKTLPNWESQLQALTAFVSIDTNLLDQNKLTHIPEGNRIQIGTANKPEIVEGYRKAGNPQALQWLDKGYVPRKEEKPGAGQIRVESRLAFFQESPGIRNRFRDIVRDLLEANNPWRQPRHFNVYLFSTLAGGTGSGSFLSASYLLQDVIRTIGKRQPRVIANLVLSTLMLEAVPRDQHMDIHANTYAGLKELEHLTKLNYKQASEEGRTEAFAYWNDESSMKAAEVHSAPFYLAFIYDTPAAFSLIDVEATVADASFLQFFTTNIDNMVSSLDNYEKNITDLTRLPGDLRNVGQGYAKNYGVNGLAALVLPANDLLQYCAKRFAAEAVRGQITFGVDPQAPGDDRATQLARLAVDYSDPKFLKMGTAGRNRAINESFLKSVQEMKRQDEREELKDGFWYELVETIDEGRETGSDESGQVQRRESTIAAVRRKLADARRKVLDKVSVRERAFSFHVEGVTQYAELVSRLEDDIRVARKAVQREMEGLEQSARRGEMVSDLKLDPIAERYLVLRLQEECEGKWIPEAQKQSETAKLKDIGTPAVRDRLRDELYGALQQAAQRGAVDRLLRRDEQFIRVRDEAFDYYRTVAAAALKLLDAEIGLAQLRSLAEYLESRSRQYAALATHMDKLVADLNKQAEELRTGLTGEPRLALSLEVFETMETPTRIWDLVYWHLYVEDGRYLTTFDRRVLSQCIVEQLKPRVRADGGIENKSTEDTVSDISRALVGLGLARLRPAIFGDESDPGLDLRRGLDLEARLIKGAAKPGRPQVNLSDGDLKRYREEKFRALSQISGVLGRVEVEKWSARQDGTTVGQTRYLTHGLENNTSPFVLELSSVLSQGGEQVNIKNWHDPRIAIVYDVKAPIALYYVNPIIDEIEKAYLKVQAVEGRKYNLHTDYHWEESLPNLNPERSELEASWAADRLAQGLVAEVIVQADRSWLWRRTLKGSQADPRREVGKTLSSVLYRLGEYHRSDSDELRSELNEQIRASLERLGPEKVRQRQQVLQDAMRQALVDIELRKQDGQITQEDVLDRPILRLLVKLLSAEFVPDRSPVTSTSFRMPFGS